MIKLALPVKDVLVTQPFGVSFTWFDPSKGKYVDFYHNIGYRGHMGVDFYAKDGCPIMATHNGKVMKAYYSSGAGNYIEILDEDYGFTTGYAHLKALGVKEGDKVMIGDVIGPADNTGVYTTGSHLHFELKLLDDLQRVINRNNGYGGCVDPAPYFKKNWDKPSAYHRYGRSQEWLAEFNMRFKNVWLHRKLGKQLNKVNDTTFINKLVYGGWSFDEAINPAMNFITDHLKKDDYKRGIKVFE